MATRASLANLDWSANIKCFAKTDKTLIFDANSDIWRHI